MKIPKSQSYECYQSQEYSPRKTKLVFLKVQQRNYTLSRLRNLVIVFYRERKTEKDLLCMLVNLSLSPVPSVGQ